MPSEMFGGETPVLAAFLAIQSRATRMLSSVPALSLNTDTEKPPSEVRTSESSNRGDAKLLQVLVRTSGISLASPRWGTAASSSMQLPLCVATPAARRPRLTQRLRQVPLAHEPVAAVGNPELNRCTGLAQSHHVRGPYRRQAQHSRRRMFKFASDPAG